jgi:hypothetical protein
MENNKNSVLGYLIFNDREKNFGFEIKSNHLNDNLKKIILDDFLNYENAKDTIEIYLKIRNEEKELAQKRKKLLKIIKERYFDDEFKNKIIDKMPELFI